MESIELCFEVKNGRTVISSAEQTACMICFEGRLRIELFYDFDTEPLRLTAEAEPGNAARVLIDPVRIALYVNGNLLDEEWPCGKSPLTRGCQPNGDFPVEIKVTEHVMNNEPPSVIRSGIATDQIRRPGVNIGDCMPYSDETGGDGRYHLFYLYDRHHHRSKWRLGAHQWAHVSTLDFNTWDEHPMAVPITQPWEGSICTGSVIRSGDLWYAWYAVRMADHSPARLTCAVSEDLIRFKKEDEYFLIPEAYEPIGARDPKLFFYGGQYHMLVTTRLQSDGSGCLAHLTNEKLSISGWKDAGCIMRWHDYCAPDSPDRKQTPECADWFRIGATFYLVFGIGSVSRYLYSCKPFGPWTYPENSTIPCGAVPKSTVLPGTNRRVFMGFRSEGGGYAGSPCAAEAFQNSDGTLRFEEMLL